VSGQYGGGDLSTRLWSPWVSLGTAGDARARRAGRRGEYIFCILCWPRVRALRRDCLPPPPSPPVLTGHVSFLAPYKMDTSGQSVRRGIGPAAWRACAVA